MTDQTRASPRRTALRLAATYVAAGTLSIVGLELARPDGRPSAAAHPAPSTWLDRLAEPAFLGTALLVGASGLLLHAVTKRGLARAQLAESLLRQARAEAAAREQELTRQAAAEAAEAERARQSLQRLEEQLQRSRKLGAIGLLAGGVAHDVNNLLGAVSGFAELARQHVPTGSPAHEELDAIRDVVERGTGFTRQLLSLSRRQTLAPSPLDLHAVLVDLGRMLPRVLGNHIELSIRTEARESTILADLSQIEQLVLNLCINARDAMPQGGRLVLQTESPRPSGADAGAPTDSERSVTLIVSDTGSGMDAATRQRIFEPFFTTKPEGQGTGLGLATVHAIVQQNGGSIACRSAPGHGTSFLIEFPLSDAEVPVPKRAPAGPLPPVPHSGARLSSSPEPTPSEARTATTTILIIDDDSQFCRAVAGMLHAAGHATLVAGNGVTGLALLRTHHVDVVLCDMLMPEKEGIETCTEMRRWHPGLPFLAMSGAPGGSNYVRIAMKLGAAGSLAKPFTAQELSDALDHALAVGQG